MVRKFAGTWWGRAWIDALENRARLDPNRLPRGRTYARQDRVIGMSVEPGMVRARVEGSRPVPYSVWIEVRPFTGDEWELALSAIASKAGHTAALLDGELEPGIVEDARAVGVELFPAAGELVPRCSCPDWADPCKHSAAVCYLVADRLDADPFELLLLRGMGREQVLADLRARRSASSPEAIPAELRPTMSAREAWSRTPRPLPPVPPPPRRRGRPAPWPSDPPVSSGLDAVALRLLAGDAVHRAWLMSIGDAGSGLDLPESADTARRAAALLGDGDFPSFANRTGIPIERLMRSMGAWQTAGADGVRALDDAPWTPDPRVMAEARQRIIQSGVPPSVIKTSRNAISWNERRVRLGHDGRWWPFEKRRGRWELSGPPATLIDDLVDGS